VEHFLAFLGALAGVYLLYRAVESLLALRRLGRYYFWDAIRLWGIVAVIALAFVHNA